MIRDRLKRAARRAAIKVLGMDNEVQEVERSHTAPTHEFDPTKVPKVVEGSGDTPGPNHHFDIGRTWVSAQVITGVAPPFVDIRTPEELAGGVLPGAILLPGALLKQHLHLLPSDKIERVVVYDQTGVQGSTELAAWLREQGWTMARRLSGGFAEWMEYGESIEMPAPIEGGTYKPGDPVLLQGQQRGWVLSGRRQADQLVYTVWLSEDQPLREVAATELGDA